MAPTPRVPTSALAAGFESGLSLAAVGREFGLSVEAVRKRLKRAGLDTAANGSNVGSRNPRWSDSPTANAGRLRAQAMYRGIERVCAGCGTTKSVQIHHKDENPANNDPSNHELLCATCHTRHHHDKNKADGRGIFWAQQHLDNWIARYIDGEDAGEIAAAFGCSYNTVVRWLKTSGVFEPYRNGRGVGARV